MTDQGEGDAYIESEPEQWGSTRPGSNRPRWLSAVTISAIVLGSLFGCCGIAGIGGLVAGRFMNPAFAQAQAKAQESPNMARVQAEMFERSAEFQQRIFPLSMTSSAIGLLHALGLIVAGVAAYGARAFGRRMLSVLCLVGIAVELVGGYVGLYVATEQNAIMAPMMDQMMQAATEHGVAEPNEEQRRAQDMARGFMSSAFQVGNVFSWAMIIGFFLVKTSYYVACALYLRRKDVVAFFEPKAAAGAALPNDG